VRVVDAASGADRGRANAGVGPTNALSRDRWLWVTDTRGDALLVFRVLGEPELVRRVHLPGGPFGLALDERKQRLLVTLTGRNEVVELPAHGRPSELRRFATVRQPDAVGVDAATGRIFVQGADALQRIDPPPLERR
jgi:sugar lactone lactonase YvrE